MQRPNHRRLAGFTVIEMLTVILIIAVVLALLLLALQGGRREAARVACVSNIRQIGQALQQYTTQYRVMPSVHTNVWAIIADQLQTPIKVDSDADFANNRNQDIPELYRCRRDKWRPSAPQGCSYAPNYQEADDESADEDPADPNGPGRDKYNRSYSPWSNFKLDGSGNPVTSRWGLIGAQALSEAGADTIIFIECWHRSNGIDVTNYQNTPLPPITAYHGPAADPTLSNPGDAGAYRLLEEFGREAAARGHVVSVKRDVYHGGDISVLCADLHAESAQAVNLTVKWAKNIPAWTRAKD